MGVNNYQTILRIELNDQICYSEHHLMVPEHFYCWVAGSFKLIAPGETPRIQIRPATITVVVISKPLS